MGEKTHQHRPLFSTINIFTHTQETHCQTPWPPSREPYLTLPPGDLKALRKCKVHLPHYLKQTSNLIAQKKLMLFNEMVRLLSPIQSTQISEFLIVLKNSDKERERLVSSLSAKGIVGGLQLRNRILTYT